MKLNEVFTVQVSDLDPDDNFANVLNTAAMSVHDAIKKAILKGFDGSLNVLGYKIEYSFSNSGGTVYVEVNGKSVGTGSMTVNQVIKKTYLTIKDDLKSKFSKPTSKTDLLQLQQDAIDSGYDMKIGPKSFTISKDKQTIMTINYTIAA